MAMYKYIATIMANMSSLVLFSFLFSSYLILFTNDPCFSWLWQAPVYIYNKSISLYIQEKLLHIIVLFKSVLHVLY
jgi:hypothetical protein